jgi:hypothetical protein
MASMGIRFRIHYLVTSVLLVALLPLLTFARLPIKWDYAGIMSGYLIGSLQSVILATLLYAISYPARIWGDKPKLVVTLGFTTVFFTVYGFIVASLFLTCALIALLSGGKQGWQKLPRVTASLLTADAYLFLGLNLAFTFISIIVKFRFYGLYDAFFNGLDQSILGMTVETLARYGSNVLPKEAFPFLESVYYGMFAQVGATLIICSLSSGRRQALQFVGAILICYYLTLVCFFIFPSMGPFAQNSTIPAYALDTYTFQKRMVQNAKHIWEQSPVQVIPLGYYISFPCMHIAQPVVVLWFLRKWKRMVYVLCVYDILLVFAILLLQWHYFVDILGGVAVAVAALLIVKEPNEVAAPITKLLEN